VKGYAKHESATLEKVVQARNMAAGANTIEGKIQGEDMLQGTLKSLFAIAEAYPDLKANTNFIDLQSQLQRIEDEIANSRKYYNAVVKELNTKVESFPSNIIAGIFQFGRKTMFEVTDQAERENVKVQF
jgi:LemA protein